MQALVVRRTRRRTRRRNFRVYKTRVAERLVVFTDPSNANRLVVQHEYALKRMHRASVTVPQAAAMMRRHCAAKHEGARENPLSYGMPNAGIGRSVAYVGVFAAIALGLGAIASGLGLFAAKQDDAPLLHTENITIDT